MTHYKDKYGLMLDSSSAEGGMGDCIGRTVLYAIAEDNYEYMKPVLDACITDNKYGFTLERHPDADKYFYKGVSRDHLSYTIIGLKYFDRQNWLQLFVNNINWKFSNFASHTIDMWLWKKSLFGNRFYGFLFYLVEIPIIMASGAWNFLLNKIGGFSKEMLVGTYIHNRPIPTSLQCTLRKWFYPTYALHILAWQVYVMRSSIGKKILQKLIYWMSPRHNYLIHNLTGHKSYIMKYYTPVNGYRWSTILNERNVRGIFRVSEGYKVDQQILKRIYANNQK